MICQLLKIVRRAENLMSIARTAASEVHLFEEDIYLSTNITEVSKANFNSSTTLSMRARSSPIKDGFVYKRRRIQRNTVALLSDRNEAEVTEKNTLSDFNLSPSDYHLALHEDSSDDVQESIDEKSSFFGNHLDLHTTFNSQLFDCKELGSVPTCVKNEQSSIREVSHSVEEFTNELCSSSTGNCNATNDTFATFKSYVPSSSVLTMAGENRGDGLNSGDILSKSLEMFESPEEMCIYVLKRHGLLGGSRRNTACVSPKNLGSVVPVFSPCKICGISEIALKMLICDDCEEAFHLSCYKFRLKKLPRDEWFCQSCITKKKKPLLRKNMGASSDISDDTSENGGRISSMLRGIRPHRSRARVGDDFQVEVSDWSGPISNDDDYFEEPNEMDHVDCCSLEGWSWSKSSKSSSFGNWLQCKDEDDRGNICGKWRRAPLFSVQTDDWDCSCALLWDPIHADCSVNQELDTEEVLKHLKYVEMFKNRLNNRINKPA